MWGLDDVVMCWLVDYGEKNEILFRSIDTAKNEKWKMKLKYSFLFT